MDHSEAKYQEVLRWFEVTKDHGEYFKAYCTGHENTNTPALSGQKHDDGGGLKCHAACTTEEILQPLGKKPSDLLVKSTVKLVRKKRNAKQAELGCTLEQ